MKLSVYIHDNPYDLQGTKEAFLKAMRENFFYHVRKNPSYSRMVIPVSQMICQDAAIISDKEANQLANKYTLEYKRAKDIHGSHFLETERDLEKIPPIPTLLFKRERLWTLKEWQMAVKATSSGTSGKQSRIGYDWESVFWGAAMAASIGRYHGLFSICPANYLMLGYEPHFTNKTMITKTQWITSLFAPPVSRTYALRCQNGEYRLDQEGLIQGLERYCRSPFPVRIVGFPSYLYFLLRFLKDKKRKYRLKPGSLVLLGGGWKNFYREQVEKDKLFDLLEDRLGILRGQVREFFGVAEHPALYCACINHHFHVPAYSRVIIRNPLNLKPLGFGEPGILNLLSPLSKGMPVLSVMTDDIAVLHEGRECGCGIESPYFEVLGRAGADGIVTCAAGASTLSNRSR